MRDRRTLRAGILVLALSGILAACAGDAATTAPRAGAIPTGHSQSGQAPSAGSSLLPSLETGIPAPGGAGGPAGSSGDPAPTTVPTDPAPGTNASSGPGTSVSPPPGATAAPSPATPGTTDAGPGPATSGQVRLMAIGDVMLARSIGKMMRAQGPGVPFAGVQGVLDQADLLAVNLECTIATTGTAAHKHYTFRAPPVGADALQLAGVDVAGQANNHALDFGPAALAQTRRLLTDRGIGVVGAGPDRAAAHAPLILVRNGLRVAFLAYVAAFSEVSGFNTGSWAATATRPGLAIAKTGAITADVHAAKARADVVVVLLHAGYEGVGTPNGQQRDFAKAAIAAGASLVIGAHPHVLQGYHRSGGTLIAYSTGNFVFDLMTGPEADTAILDVTLTAAGVTSLRWVPVHLDARGLPKLAHGKTAARILKRLHPI